MVTQTLYLVLEMSKGSNVIHRIVPHRSSYFKSLETYPRSRSTFPMGIILIWYAYVYLLSYPYYINLYFILSNELHNWTGLCKNYVSSSCPKLPFLFDNSLTSWYASYFVPLESKLFTAWLIKQCTVNNDLVHKKWAASTFRPRKTHSQNLATIK